MGHRLDNGSCMSGDVHVQFCERLWGKFLRATLLVVMARYMGRRITDWLEDIVEDQLKLSINRKKTKVVKMK